MTETIGDRPGVNASGGEICAVCVLMLILSERGPTFSLKRDPPPEGGASYDSSDSGSFLGCALGLVSPVSMLTRDGPGPSELLRAISRRWGGIYVPPCFGGRLSLVR